MPHKHCHIGMQGRTRTAAASSAAASRGTPLTSAPTLHGHALLLWWLHQLWLLRLLLHHAQLRLLLLEHWLLLLLLLLLHVGHLPHASLHPHQRLLLLLLGRHAICGLLHRLHHLLRLLLLLLQWLLVDVAAKLLLLLHAILLQWLLWLRLLHLGRILGGLLHLLGQHAATHHASHLLLRQ